MSKNAEGWIRHRGGKCPVEDGVKVDYRMRSGDVDSFGRKSDTLYWDHDNEGGDIMAYRLHKPAEQVEACSKPELRISLPENYGEIIGGSVEGPLQWRDRITEIDATTQALTAERAELVQKLASEGFALIGRVVEPVEDMSDWRNWKEGDLLEMVKASDWEEMTNGKLYEFAAPENRDNFAVVDDNGELRSFHIGSDDFVSGDFKWHSRPSA